MLLYRCFKIFITVSYIRTVYSSPPRRLPPDAGGHLGDRGRHRGAAVPPAQGQPQANGLVGQGREGLHLQRAG